MGYHTKKITKGNFGEFSKIKEEIEELLDAHKQGNSVMELIEISNLLGAIEEYLKRFNMTLDDILKMTKATREAFEEGERK
jgi:phosphoribosyl-ATP pyrophosphohydrolase